MRRRNKFISRLSIDLKGNTLILYSRVESHGRILYDMINNFVTNDRKVFFIHGGVDAEDREKVREITEQENNAIIVALMEHSLQASILGGYTTLFLLLNLSLELETSNPLEEF